MRLIMHVPWDILSAGRKVEWTKEDLKSFSGIQLKDREPTSETLNAKPVTINGYSY